MQTSSSDRAHAKASTKKKRSSILVVVLLLALVIPANIVMCLALMPYGAQSEVMWSEFRKTEQIDTVFVGSSLTANGLNPMSFDEALGSHSFNMASPGQSIRDNLRALQEAASEHNITRVVTLVGYETFAVEPSITYSLPFMQAKSANEPPLEAAAGMVDLFLYKPYLMTASSIRGLFPWSCVHIDLSPACVKLNINNRLHCDVLEANVRYNEFVGSSWRYYGQGFGDYIDKRTAGHSQGQGLGTSVGKTLSATNLEAFEELCSYCADQGIELYVFAGPYTPALMNDYRTTYIQEMSKVKALAESRGGHYFDLGMVQRDTLGLVFNDYNDASHLNYDGATKAGTFAAQLIGRVEKGEDVSSLFYAYDDAGWKAYCDSIDYVDGVDYTYCLDENGNAVVKAVAPVAEGTPVEYQFETKAPGASKWTVVRAYGPDSTMVIERGNNEVVEVRVSARATNGKQDKDRWVTGSITF